MRYALLAAALLAAAPLAGRAQTIPPSSYHRALPVVPIDSVTHQIVYRGVLPAAGLPQAEVYGRAQEWVARQFEDYSAVVQLADAGRGVLIGQAMLQAVAPAQKNQDARRIELVFRFRLRAQPGALHYELTDISYPLYSGTSYSNTDIPGHAADGLAQWQRADDYSRISTTAAQTRRAPVEPRLRDYDEYTSEGKPKPRMLQVCLGIQDAMTGLVASLNQELRQPLP
ncbi:DUF4468 domain-containing protein [Hymenobacter rigui]|uniref:DUF4468 domain-containing protein n=1 Tax=Hymenobacter rigui TaxID=334424 RepID=A0A428KSP3_9BACT|nr:DUF4468 domain-containing protein [Hymenobacter rigui]RSK49532.1 DUF4468 domain-containing protein [Hymenobacter rigui]